MPTRLRQSRFPDESNDEKRILTAKNSKKDRDEPGDVQVRFQGRTLCKWQSHSWQW